ncbi:TPA: hypothetical protein DCR49_07320 [Candidatus Delongbacteria bacterium]|nr:hypothetical protein [Candidatus Delongbacteria bacterium]
MKNFSLKSFIAAILICGSILNLSAETTLQTVDFETANSGYTVLYGQTTSPDDWWERAAPAQIAPMDPFSGYQGSYFFYAEDTDNGRTADDPCYVTLNQINVAGYTNIKIKLLVAGKNNIGSSLELEEYLRIQYSVDGGAFTTFMQYMTPALNAIYYSEDTDLNGSGNGTALSPAFAEFTYNIPVTGSTLQIRFMGNVDQGNEEYAFDYVRILGTEQVLPPGTPENITIVYSSSLPEFTWSAAANATSYKIYSAPDPYAVFPAGWTLEASGITATSWTDTNASASAKKFYVVVAVN